jgi:hypothetical protein
LARAFPSFAIRLRADFGARMCVVSFWVGIRSYLCVNVMDTRYYSILKHGKGNLSILKTFTLI